MKNMENFPKYIVQNFGTFVGYVFGEPNRVVLAITKTKPRKEKVCRKCGDIIPKGIFGCISFKFGTVTGKLFNRYFHEDCYMPILEKLAEFVLNLDSNKLNFESLNSGFIEESEYNEILAGLEGEKINGENQ